MLLAGIGYSAAVSVPSRVSNYEAATRQVDVGAGAHTL